MPKPEERQRGDREDRVAEAHGELDEDRRHDVGQDLDEHDVGRPLAAQLGGGHVVELALRQHRGAHRAGDERREDEADDDDRRGRRRADRGDQRSSATMITGSASRASTIRPRMSSTSPREVAHDQPQRRAQHRAEQGRRRRDDQDVAGAGDDAREHVAAELVGAEPVLAGRRLEHVAGWSRRDPGGQPGLTDRAEHPEADDDRADDEASSTAQQRAQRLPRAAERASGCTAGVIGVGGPSARWTLTGRSRRGGSAG